jgi:hypothetical protein
MSRVLRDAFSPGSPACPSSWLLDGGACPGPAAAAVGVDDLAAPPPPGDALYLLQGWRGGVGGGGATDSEQPDLHALVGNEAADVCSVDDGKHAARASRDSGTGTACRPGRAGRGSHARGSSRGAGTASAAAAALKCSRKGATRAQREAHRRYRQRRKTMVRGRLLCGAVTVCVPCHHTRPAEAPLSQTPTRAHTHTHAHACPNTHADCGHGG